MPGRLNPTRTMVQLNTALTGDPSDFCTSDDMVVMGLQAATHWDGLAHVSYAGRLYNGFPADSVTWAGATALGIHHIRTLVTRGVLLDVARAKGAERLERRLRVHRRRSGRGVRVGQGLGRTRRRSSDPHRTDAVSARPAAGQVGYAVPAPGPSTKTVQWFRDHDVAAVATDNLTFEVYPCEFDDAILPVHPLHLVEMGMTQGQNWQLEDLAEDCASDGIYEFLLEASPQPFTNAVGSPVNPVAVK